LGNTLCEMKVESIYTPNLVNECLKSLGTTDENHPYVGVIMK
jgi:ATP sulfurylase